MILALALFAGLAAPVHTENVVLVTYDGLRWQEVFCGADPALLSKEAGGVEDLEGIRAAYWRESAEARREALLPFLWTAVAKQGQIYGDASKGCTARVTNEKNFSYPGYHELLCGFGDPRIDSNDKRPNPNVTVLEWLNGKEAFRGKVAAFTQWDCFPWILNRERSGLFVNAGHETIPEAGISDRERVLNEIARETNWPDDDQRSDALTFLMGEAYLRRASPRVLYFGFGETDSWAHAGRYDLVLEAAHRTDAELARLWASIQSTPGYAGKTSLVITTDHGRGAAPVEWKSHGAKLPVSDRIWIAVIGPDTPALGVREGCGEVTQGQVAATVAALLGEDWCAAEPRAAKPIADAAAGRAR
jgi:Type I phosphodiesterase / nucleotide pyrophosphatase